jgi:hypothetical protein
MVAMGAKVEMLFSVGIKELIPFNDIALINTIKPRMVRAALVSSKQDPAEKI